MSQASRFVTVPANFDLVKALLALYKQLDQPAAVRSPITAYPDFVIAAHNVLHSTLHYQFREHWPSLVKAVDGMVNNLRDFT